MSRSIHEAWEVPDNNKIQTTVWNTSLIIATNVHTQPQNSLFWGKALHCVEAFSITLLLG